MTSLTDRIEAATGPDRELDYAIFCNVVFPNHKHKWDPSDNNHRYTGSIDVALTLGGSDAIMLLREAISDVEAYLGPATDLKKIAALPRFICAAALRARGVE